MITAKQIRMARTGLDWSQEKLAQEAGIGIATIGNIEKEQTRGAAKTIEKIERCLSKYFDFLPNNGVVFRTKDISEFRGREGHIHFQWDVYNEVKRNGGEICVSNVNERDSLKWLGYEEAQKYREAMTDIKKRFFFKILIEEGDDYFAAGNYAEYRWVSKKDFGDASFYVYGDKLAIITYNEDSRITLIENKAAANAYRGQFDVLWRRAKNINHKG